MKDLKVFKYNLKLIKEQSLHLFLIINQVKNNQNWKRNNSKNTALTVYQMTWNKMYNVNLNPIMKNQILMFVIIKKFSLLMMMDSIFMLYKYYLN